MKKPASSNRMTLAVVVLAMAAAVFCGRKSSVPGASPVKTAPALQYTPKPEPPTPTLRPGQPTRLPSLPG